MNQTTVQPSARVLGAAGGPAASPTLIPSELWPVFKASQTLQILSTAPTLLSASSH